MTIGEHKVGRLFMQARNSLWGGAGGVFSNKVYRVSDVQKYAPEGVSGDQLPKAPANPYRKRPTKMIYDKNEFHMFRLPSEKSFLLGGFDEQQVFGPKKGLAHSSHLQAQVNLDTNMVYGYMLFLLLGLMWETKRTYKFQILKENFVQSDMGFFTSEDFK